MKTFAQQELLKGKDIFIVFTPTVWSSRTMGIVKIVFPLLDAIWNRAAFDTACIAFKLFLFGLLYYNTLEFYRSHDQLIYTLHLKLRRLVVSNFRSETMGSPLMPGT